MNKLTVGSEFFGYASGSWTPIFTWSNPAIPSGNYINQIGNWHTIGKLGWVNINVSFNNPSSVYLSYRFRLELPPQATLNIDTGVGLTGIFDSTVSTIDLQQHPYTGGLVYGSGLQGIIVYNGQGNEAVTDGVPTIVALQGTFQFKLV